MPKKPNVQIRMPGQQPAADTGDKEKSDQAHDERVALTVKVSSQDYERLLMLKARRREPVQRILERTIKNVLDNEGV